MVGIFFVVGDCSVDLFSALKVPIALKSKVFFVLFAFAFAVGAVIIHVAFFNASG